MPRKKSRLSRRKQSKTFVAWVQLADLQKNLKKLLEEKKQIEENGEGNLDWTDRQITEVRQQIQDFVPPTNTNWKALSANGLLGADAGVVEEHETVMQTLYDGNQDIQIYIKEEEPDPIQDPIRIEDIETKFVAKATAQRDNDRDACDSISTISECENRNEQCTSNNTSAVRTILVGKAAIESTPTSSIESGKKKENVLHNSTIQKECVSTSHISNDSSLYILPTSIDANENRQSTVCCSERLYNYNAEGNAVVNVPSLTDIYEEVLILLEQGKFKINECMHKIDREANCIKFFSLTSGRDIAIEKAVIMTQDVEFKVFAHGVPVHSENNYVRRLKDSKYAYDLKKALIHVFSATVCPGNTEEKYTEVLNENNVNSRGLDGLQAFKSVHNGQVAIKSYKCFVLFEGKLCPKCRRLRNALASRIQRREGRDTSQDYTSRRVRNDWLSPGETMLKFKQYRNLVQNLMRQVSTLEKRNDRLQRMCLADVSTNMTEVPSGQFESTAEEESSGNSSTGLIYPDNSNEQSHTLDKDNIEVSNQPALQCKVQTNTNRAQSNGLLDTASQFQRPKTKRTFKTGKMFAKSRSRLRSGSKAAKKRKAPNSLPEEKLLPSASFYKRMRRIRCELSVVKTEGDHSYNENLKGFADPSKNRVCLESGSNNRVQISQKGSLNNGTSVCVEIVKTE